MLIVGVNIPDKKRVDIALTYIFGVGRHSSIKICEASKVDRSIRTNQLDNDQIIRITNVLKSYDIETNLRAKIAMKIKLLKDINCYRGMRHKKGINVRGQRTHTNAKTARKLLKRYIKNK